MENAEITDTWQQEQVTSISPELHPSSISNQSNSIPCLIAVPSKPTYGHLTILADPILCSSSPLETLPYSPFDEQFKLLLIDTCAQLWLNIGTQKFGHIFFYQEKPHLPILARIRWFWSREEPVPLDGLAELNRNGQWRWSWKCGWGRK